VGRSEGCYVWGNTDGREPFEGAVDVAAKMELVQLAEEIVNLLAQPRPRPSGGAWPSSRRDVLFIGRMLVVASS
jgi:hypothetical protein